VVGWRLPSVLVIKYHFAGLSFCRGHGFVKFPSPFSCAVGCSCYSYGSIFDVFLLGTANIVVVEAFVVVNLVDPAAVGIVNFIVVEVPMSSCFESGNWC